MRTANYGAKRMFFGSTYEGSKQSRMGGGVTVHVTIFGSTYEGLKLQPHHRRMTELSETFLLEALPGKDW